MTQQEMHDYTVRVRKKGNLVSIHDFSKLISESIKCLISSRGSTMSSARIYDSLIIHITKRITAYRIFLVNHVKMGWLYRKL